MNSTRDEVFPDVLTVPFLTSDRVRVIRNAAQHGKQVFPDDLTYLRRFADHVSERLLGSPVWASPESPINASPAPAPETRSSPASDIEAGAAPSEAHVGLIQVMPFYVVCDCSASMTGNPISAVNTSLRTMIASLTADPVVSSKSRISVVAFSSTARVVSPLMVPSDALVLENLDASGVTNYGEAFRLLSATISRDLDELSKTHSPLRPVIFFLTDGEPVDQTWRAAMTDLLDASNAFAPTLIFFPIGAIDREFFVGLQDIEGILPPQCAPLGGDVEVADAARRAMAGITNSIVGTVMGVDSELVLRI